MMTTMTTMTTTISRGSSGAARSGGLSGSRRWPGRGWTHTTATRRCSTSRPEWPPRSRGHPFIPRAGRGSSDWGAASGGGFGGAGGFGLGGFGNGPVRLSSSSTHLLGGSGSSSSSSSSSSGSSGGDGSAGKNSLRPPQPPSCVELAREWLGRLRQRSLRQCESALRVGPAGSRHLSEEQKPEEESGRRRMRQGRPRRRTAARHLRRRATAKPLFGRLAKSMRAPPLGLRQ